MTEEKRRFSRIIFNVRGELVVDDTVYAVDRIANLSIGGCMLEIDEEQLFDRECLFTLFLPRMDPGVEVRGRIVRVGKNKVCIQFTKVEPENLSHLQNIIRYNSEDPEKIEQEIKAHPGLK